MNALGGGSGKLSQGGGCPEDPDNANPLPGQGRGGKGSPGRLRIETQQPTGSVLIQKGTFSRAQTQPEYGLLAQSKWYALNDADSVAWTAIGQGLKPDETLSVQTTTANPDGTPDPAQASAWSEDLSVLPPGGFLRFRVQLVAPTGGALPSTVTQVKIEYLSPLP